MKTILFFAAMTIGFSLIAFATFPALWMVAGLTGILFLAALYDYLQPSHSITRNFPLVGHTRYIAEWLRPKLYQYFVESDTEGRPFSRLNRSIVYQRAKNVLDTSPFGTQLDVYGKGYEWMNHSIAALDVKVLESFPVAKIGGPDCLQPYKCSLYNVAAMSFGSLSKNAVMALNGGASLGRFAHNTGEGGISPYHLKYGGDLIYQIGTGYFGSRDEKGGFSEENYQLMASKPSVKMIELKLSQGAKPGHGGILPARKVTKEISRIRNVPMGKDVISPPFHRAFSTPVELLQFIKKLRDLSGGKPVGFKLCIGSREEFVAICKAMIHTGIRPDFISVDGGEGGTGAAPLEFSNSVGMPMKDGLAFVMDALVGFDLKKDIKLISAGKIVTGFDIFRALAIGADACYSARAMMMAVGCIQALECNKNTCPVGVTTHDDSLVRGLDVGDKRTRVYEFHKDTIHSFVQLLAAAGLTQPEMINRSHVYRRVENNLSMRYDEIYPYITRGCLLEGRTIPEEWKPLMALSTAETFMTKYDIAYES